MTISMPQLRALDAVACEGSISRAAQKLGVSQPSISNHISAFESSWQVRFFLRDGYSISVNPEVDSILGQIRLLLNVLEGIETALTAKSAGEAKTLNLGFSAHRLIMPALSKFVATYPEVSVNTQGAPTYELMAALRKGELHLVSVSLSEAPSNLHSVKVANRRLMIYGKPDNVVLQQTAVRIEDLHDVPMVLWNQNSGSRRQFASLCHQAGISLKVSLEVNTLDVAYAAVAAGIGLGVAIEGEIAPDNNIIAVPLEADGATVNQYLLCLKGAEMRPQIRAFLDLAVSETVNS